MYYCQGSKTEWILLQALSKVPNIGSIVPQAKLGPYQVDIYLPRFAAVVEVDGPWHWTEEVSRTDSVRDAYLRQQGIYVVRIPSEQVRENPPAAARYVVDQARSYGKSTTEPRESTRMEVPAQ